jgi:hypothetical protein
MCFLWGTNWIYINYLEKHQSLTFKIFWGHYTLNVREQYWMEKRHYDNNNITDSMYEVTTKPRNKTRIKQIRNIYSIITNPYKNGRFHQDILLFKIYKYWNSRESEDILNNYIFWDITPCSPLKANLRVRGICCLPHKNRRISQREAALLAIYFKLVSCLAYSSTLKM